MSHEWVLCALVSCTLATKPGGALLFHRLSDSTIGAVRFHGRVRDGIGWVTDAMATKLCGQRVGWDAKSMLVCRLLCLRQATCIMRWTRPFGSGLVIDGGGSVFKRE